MGTKGGPIGDYRPPMGPQQDPKNREEARMVTHLAPTGPQWGPNPCQKRRGPPPMTTGGGGGGQQNSAENSQETGGRKRRVKVTPKDWDALEQVSNRLGVGYATVYRIAFRQFIDRLEDQEAIS